MLCTQVVGGHDLMCKSRTGSGKTLAFAIPIIEALHRQVTPSYRTVLYLGMLPYHEFLVPYSYQVIHMVWYSMV